MPPVALGHVDFLEVAAEERGVGSDDADVPLAFFVLDAGDSTAPKAPRRDRRVVGKSRAPLDT